MATVAEQVAAFRRFNRMYTRLIGTLDEGLLSTDFSLAEARVLYELATRLEPKAKEISEGIGMDPGYLSRILGKFERSGLLKRKASTEDSRWADLMLTRKGKSASDRLNSLSDKQARTILQGLSLAERNQLVRSLQSVERILLKEKQIENGASRPPYVLRQHRAGDMVG